MNSNDEYYGAVSGGMEQTRCWEVYFSLHNRRNGEWAGKEVPLNTCFSWYGCHWQIPSAYICAKGLVLDVFAEVNGDDVRGFLSRQMRAQAESDGTEFREKNPLTIDFDIRIAVNGKPLRQAQSIGKLWVKGYEEYTSDVMREALAHYHLDPERCWIYRRISFSWVTRTRPAIKKILLHMEQRPTSVWEHCFCVNGAGDYINFVHPITGVDYTMIVRDYEQARVNFDRYRSEGYEYPTNHTRMVYTLLPNIPGDHFRVSDVMDSDEPRKIQTDPKKKGLYQQCDFADAITLIGGVDGPMAVFIGMPEDERRLHTVSSALTFEPQERIVWKITFFERTVEDLSLFIAV